MSAPFIGEMKIIPWSFAPKGWALCNGQLLQISQNQTLFSVLGTTYGGDGRTTFALPNLQGRTPMHVGTNPAGQSYVSLGQKGGEAGYTLDISELPGHNHIAMASTANVNVPTPPGNFWGKGSALTPYSNNPPSVPMSSSAIGSAGQGQAHNNLQPYLVLNVIIALQGIFPSQN